MHLLGTTIGQYQILEQIGQGGMATVYKAYQPNLDRFVAIKVLAPETAKSPGFKERFFQEAKAAAHLSHPNILPVYDVGMENNLCYIVMKYIRGCSLRDVMGDKMDLSRVCHYIEQVASALDHAHAQGIIHRDIKSQNLLLEGDWVFLTDFGIAKIMEATLVLTHQGELLGTPYYMSPEQASGKELDHRTDIYSLGVVLFEMLTGTLPYRGDTPYGVIFKHIHEPLPSPRTFRPDLPESVELVVFKALAKDRDQRYKRAGLLAEALWKAASAEHPTSPGRPSRAFAAPEAPEAPEAGVVANEETIAASRKPDSAPSAESREKAPEAAAPVARKRSVAIPIALVLLLLTGLAAAVFYLLPRPKPEIPPPTASSKPDLVRELAVLRVQSTPPGAQVFVDEAIKGRTPLRMELPLGKPLVRLTLPDYEDWEDQIPLQKAREYPVTVELKARARTASLKISSKPEGAEIYVNDSLRGKTSIDERLPLGDYSIRVALSGHDEFREVVSLGEQKEYYYKIQLVPTRAPREIPPDQGPQQPLSVWKEPETGMEFIKIPAGCFQMGCEPQSRECDADESPNHRVCVDAFWLSRTEVTVGQFQRFVRARSYRTDAERNGWSWAFNLNNRTWETLPGGHWRNAGFAQNENHPVVNVSWNDAVSMAQWLSGKGRGRFGLPSEAQWEWAARGAKQTVRFWGDDAGEACRYANAADTTLKRQYPNNTTHTCDDGHLWTSPVAGMAPNPFGLFDMLGNVWEWWDDVYHQGAYAQHEPRNPLYGGPGPGRVFRGGSWSSSPKDVRCGNRYYSPAEGSYQNLGFRLMRME